MGAEALPPAAAVADPGAAADPGEAPAWVAVSGEPDAGGGSGLRAVRALSCLPATPSPPTAPLTPSRSPAAANPATDASARILELRLRAMLRQSCGASSVTVIGSPVGHPVRPMPRRPADGEVERPAAMPPAHGIGSPMGRDDRPISAVGGCLRGLRSLAARAAASDRTLRPQQPGHQLDQGPEQQHSHAPPRQPLKRRPGPQQPGADGQPSRQQQASPSRCPGQAGEQRRDGSRGGRPPAAGADRSAGRPHGWSGAGHGPWRGDDQNAATASCGP